MSIEIIFSISLIALCGASGICIGELIKSW